MSEPSRKLSTEEVNALMEGLRSGDLSTSTSLKDSSTVEYKAFNFLSFILFSMFLIISSFYVPVWFEMLKICATFKVYIREIVRRKPRSRGFPLR